MQDQSLTPVQHRFFSLNRADSSGAIFAITQEEAEAISNNFVWKVNTK